MAMTPRRCCEGEETLQRRRDAAMVMATRRHYEGEKVLWSRCGGETSGEGKSKEGKKWGKGLRL